MRRAKIVCTIGPASRDEETIVKLIDAGMNVARLNFSHGEHEEHREVYERVRRLSDRVAIIQDLSGPKIRVGEIDGGEMRLVDGGTLTLTTGEVGGRDEVVQVLYDKLPSDVKPGDNIYLADGIIHLEVEGITGADVSCRIINGGVLSSRKGLNLPGVTLSAPSLTEKDRIDLDFGMKLGVDAVALSFVRNAAEVGVLRDLLDEKGSAAWIIAKIEKREALEQIDEIIEAADAVMIARGDLGVEISTEEVPLVQKSIIVKCLGRGKPVITATQMLESMVTSERPTRAEASDVANAVLDGTDAVMLSAETAIGRYPIEAVRIMDRIIRKVEEYGGRPALLFEEGPDSRRVDERGEQDAGTIVDAVCAGAVKVADELGASAIATLTHTGRTARLLSRYRPRVPILALTDSVSAAKQVSLLWGVEAIPVDRIREIEEIIAIVREKMRSAGYSGRIVMTAGIPTKEKKPTNTAHVVEI